MFNVFGFHGRVTFDEEIAGDTQILYEVQVYGNGTGPFVYSALPGVPFYTFQLCAIRARGVITGTGVTLLVEYDMAPPQLKPGPLEKAKQQSSTDSSGRSQNAHSSKPKKSGGPRHGRATNQLSHPRPDQVHSTHHVNPR